MAKGLPKGRQPATGQLGKRPVAERLPTRVGLDQRPVFSFEYADRGSPHSFGFAPGRVDADAVLTFLQEISGNSWLQLREHKYSSKRQSRPKHHDQAVSSICRDAQSRLASMQLDEVIGEDLFRFRLGGKARLWGFRAENVFYVLWWDPEHEVYPVD